VSAVQPIAESPEIQESPVPALQGLIRFFSASMPVACAMLLMLVVPAALEAQFNSGTIAGTVVDPGGGAVAGCKVTAVSLTSGGARAVETSSSGLFSMPSPAADTCEVTGSARPQDVPGGPPFQVRADFFHAFSHPAFAVGAPPNGRGTQSITAPTYGRLVYACPPRSMTVSLKRAFWT
jgi:hypothetical protein